MAAPLRLAAKVTLDTTGVPAGAQATKAAIATIGDEGTRSAIKLQKLIDAQLGIAQPAANMNSRAADMAAYGAELDRQTAKFVPLVAAQQKYRDQLERIEQARRIGAISASQAIDLKLKERNAYEALASSMERVAISQKRAIEGAVARITVTPDRGADIAAYGDKLDGLRARYNPLFAVVTSYKSALTDIREAHKVGAISADEMTAAISRQRQATLASIDAIKGRDNQRGGGSDAAGQFRRQNLTYQLFDIGQTAYMGMNPAMIFAQQGPQILQLYAGQGGVNAAVKDFGTIASGAARLVTPLTASIAGLAAVTLTGLAAWNSYLTSTKEVETAASGLGRAVAGSSAEMEAAARAGASAAGISVSSARSMQAQFLSTGRIGSENFEALIAVSKEFGATIGLDAASAGQALAEMFADPAKAAETLYRQYGLIDAATARQAINLAQQNRASEAQAVLLDALPDRLASAAEATTALGRAWNTVSTAASNAYDAIGGAVDRVFSGPSLDEQIADLEASLARTPRPGQRGRSNGLAQRQELEALIAQREIRDREAAQRREEAERIRLSVAATTIAEASPANAGALRIQTLRNDIEAMQRGNTGEGEQRDQVNTAIEAKTRVLDALINRQARSAELDQLDIQIQTERNPIIRADLEARRVRLTMAEQEVSTAKIAEEAEKARNRVIAESVAGARLQASDLTTEVEVRKSLNAQVAAGTITSSQAQTMLEAELQLRPLIAAAASAEGAAKQQLLAVIDQLRAGYAGMAEAQKDASAASIIRNQQTDLETLRAELALIGQSEAVRRRSLALLQAEQQIRREGIASTSAAATEIRTNEIRIANERLELERATDAWDAYRSAGESAIDGVVDALSKGDIDGALESIASEISKTALELAVSNPLKNSLLGTNYGTVADLFAGQGAGATAMGSSLSSMAVTAGTVIVNGGVSSGLGGAVGSNTAANTNVAGGYSGLAATGAMGIPGSAVDRAMGMLGATETGSRGAVNSFLKAGGVDIDAATTAWCAGFVNSALKQVGVDGSGSLLANSFQNWGKLVDPTSVLKGDVLLKTNGLGADAVGGHVGLATGASRMLGGERQLQMLSGNSGNAVSLDWINASELQVRRATEAAASMQGLATNATNATQGLGVFGNGLGQMASGLGAFGQQVANIAAGGGASSGGGLFGSLLGGIGKLSGGISPSSALLAPNTTFGSFLVNGYSDGGWTGRGGKYEPAGVVHRGEIVWSQQDIARWGGPSVVESLRLADRGYANGGIVGGSANDNRFGFGAPSFQIINNTSTPMTGEVEETGTDERGRRQYRMVVSDAVSDGISAPGGQARKAMSQTYGLRPRGIGL